MLSSGVLSGLSRLDSRVGFYLGPKNQQHKHEERINTSRNNGGNIYSHWMVWMQQIKSFSSTMRSIQKWLPKAVSCSVLSLFVYPRFGHGWLHRSSKLQKWIPISQNHFPITIVSTHVCASTSSSSFVWSNRNEKKKKWLQAVRVRRENWGGENVSPSSKRDKTEWMVKRREKGKGNTYFYFIHFPKTNK